jgi:hypothetical protein
MHTKDTNSALSINIVSAYITVQCIIFMLNYIVFTILTSFTSSVSVRNDGFMEYNKKKKKIGKTRAYFESRSYFFWNVVR